MQSYKEDKADPREEKAYHVCKRLHWDHQVRRLCSFSPYKYQALTVKSLFTLTRTLLSFPSLLLPPPPSSFHTTGLYVKIHVQELSSDAIEDEGGMRSPHGEMEGMLR